MHAIIEVHAAKLNDLNAEIDRNGNTCHVLEKETGTDFARANWYWWILRHVISSPLQ